MKLLTKLIVFCGVSAKIDSECKKGCISDFFRTAFRCEVGAVRRSNDLDDRMIRRWNDFDVRMIKKGKNKSFDRRSHSKC